MPLAEFKPSGRVTCLVREQARGNRAPIYRQENEMPDKALIELLLKELLSGNIGPEYRLKFSTLV